MTKAQISAVAGILITAIVGLLEVFGVGIVSPAI